MFRSNGAKTASSLHFGRSPSDTGWDLGPGTLCGHGCSVYTWTSASSSNKTQRRQITACVWSWGKLWTTRYAKIETTTCQDLKSREQKQGVGRKCSTRASGTQHHQRVGSPPTPGPSLPSPHMRNWLSLLPTPPHLSASLQPT